ncbi:RNA-directed DNA polymerase, partial [Klebsiella pneumoniae]|uniref:RNA-directed DNA polymerase n=1 Tax=Klebsiella pneumoniae TaxID=573 RepID=UPI0035324BC0
YILFDRRLKSKVLDTRVYAGAHCGKTDHYLVVSRVILGEKWTPRKKAVLAQKRVRVERMQDREVRSEYTRKVNERLAQATMDWDQQVVNECDIEWGFKLLKETCLTSAEEVCGIAKCGRKSGNGWWNKEVRMAVESKKAAYLKMLTARSVKTKQREMHHLNEAYIAARNKAKEMVKQSKMNVRRMLEVKMQSNFEGNRKLYWKMVNQNKGGDTRSAVGVKNAEGDIVWDDDEIRDCWRDYFQDLFQSDAQGDPQRPQANARLQCNNSAVSEPPQDFGMKELQRAVRALKNGKAAGVDGITAEMLKYGGAVLDVKLLELFNACYKCKKVPEEWKNAVIVPLYKGKGERCSCKNYRGISLLSVPGKVYGRLVIARVQEKTQQKISDVQGGFMPGRGCTDQIFTVQQIIEKCVAVRKKVYMAFVDLEKAYDRVDRECLWRVLEEYGVNGMLLGAIQAMYEGSKACVRVNGGLSEWFGVTAGVRQGCVMSPWLFNIFMDKCIRMAEMNDRGLQVGGRQLSVLLYADDALLLAESEVELQDLLNSLNESVSSMHLRINASKTKVLVVCGENGDAMDVTLGGERVERVSEFVYLGRMFDESGSLGGEIGRRVQAGRRVVGSMAGLAKSEVLSTQAKLAVYNSVLVPTVLYGSESWVCLAEHTSKVNAVGMSFLRYVCGKTRMDKVRNEWVMSQCGVKETLCERSESNMLRWFGHVGRMGDERIVKQVYECVTEGDRPRGAPRKTWNTRVGECLKKREVLTQIDKRGVRRACVKKYMDVNEAKEACKERAFWRSVVKRT